MNLNLEFKLLDIDKIHRNPSNPRGVYSPTEDSSFMGLVESIGVFGIIVPLIVKEMENDTYMIIDGDRRYNAAVKARRPQVPAYIITNNTVDGTQDYILTMYQIHMNRKDWEPATQQKYSELLQEQIRQTILAEMSTSKESTKKLDNDASQINIKGIEDDIGKIGKENEVKDLEKCVRTKHIDEEKLRNKVASRLSELTGMKTGRAKENILFSEWPQEIKEEIREHQTNRKYYNYVITLENSFIQPLVNTYPLLIEKEGLYNIRTNLYKKVKKRIFGSAASIREVNFLFDMPKTDEDQRQKVEDLIKRFILETELDIKQLNSFYYNTFPEDIKTVGISVDEYILSINRLINQFNEYNMDNFNLEDNKEISEKLLELKIIIEQMLKS